jgi:hypothetical protein
MNIPNVCARGHVNEPRPPGETGRELTSIDAIAVFDNALKEIAGPPRMAIKGVKDIDVRKVGSWVIVKIKFKRTKGANESNEVTFRIRKAWAQVMCSRLERVLGK